MAFVEDTAVDPTRLGDYTHRFAELLERPFLPLTRRRKTGGNGLLVGGRGHHLGNRADYDRASDPIIGQ